jgi:hypothetical protein
MLKEIAQESIKNVSAIIKKFTGRDIKNMDIHIQFIGTYGGVDGDSASISVATAVISAVEGIPIHQDLAMTGSLSVRGEVLPVGGVTYKIEAAAKAGIKKVLIQTYEQDPQDFTALLEAKGAGPKTIRALALLSEIIYGTEVFFLLFPSSMERRYSSFSSRASSLGVVANNVVDTSLIQLGGKVGSFFYTCRLYTYGQRACFRQFSNLGQVIFGRTIDQRLPIGTGLDTSRKDIGFGAH